MNRAPLLTLRSFPAQRSLKTFCLFLGLFFISGYTSLSAEKNYYSSTRPRGKIVQELVEKMAKAGFKFKIRKVYNENRDGHSGFVFWLLPRRTHCEITFHHKKAGKGTIVKIYTQDRIDSSRFHSFFTRQMKMKQWGSINPGQKGGGWPQPR